jgi:hypothetical protein
MTEQREQAREFEGVSLIRRTDDGNWSHGINHACRRANYNWEVRMIVNIRSFGSV